MRKWTLIALLIGLGFMASRVDTQIPSSSRSGEAIARVKPRLERELKAKGLAYGSPIFIRIFKQPKQLEVWVKGPKKFELFRTYKIRAYSGSLGPKQREGDLQAPEGFYFVKPSWMNPNSTFHLSFNIGYPNAYDRAHKRTGSEIMVHGSCVSIGCFAMTDERVEEIYALADAALRNGQPSFRVHIFPFRMTAKNMKRHQESEWFDFWSNLKEGCDFFEKTGHPPDALVRSKRYVFEKVQGG